MLSVCKYPLHFYNKQSPNKVPKNVDYIHICKFPFLASVHNRIHFQRFLSANFKLKTVLHLTRECFIYLFSFFFCFKKRSKWERSHARQNIRNEMNTSNENVEIVKNANVQAMHSFSLWFLPMVVVRCDAVRFQSLFILKWYLKGDKKRTHRISNVAEKNKFNKDAKLGKNGHRVFSRKIQQPTHSAIAFGSKCPFLMITVHIHILLVYKICCCSFHIVHMVFGIFSSNFLFRSFPSFVANRPI